MRSSTRTPAAAAVCAQFTSPRVWFCCIILIAFATLSASAQTDITATTTSTTVQYLGVPNPQNTTDNAVTAPLGGIILKGTGISPITGQPFRHLWVDDATSGLCRVDPDLDSPGPYKMTITTCPFKINGASVTGGPLAFDPTRNLLYFADEQRASQGVMRIGFLPDGDSGHGLLDFNSVFIMGGNTTGARFGGGDTGCPLVFGVPGGTGLLPHAVALSPLGDLYVGFKKNGAIVRFNSPGTADATGFGTCSQFIQQVATVSKLTNGLAWIGHDLWGADGTSPFFIKNADTICAVPPHAACTAPADIITVLPQVAGATSTMSDQYYPATNGNNVYFTLAVAGTPQNTVWLGNASAATAAMTGTTLDTAFFGVFSPAAGPAFTIANLNGLAVDQSDPANIVLYSGDDYSGAGILAKGMWFQSCQGTYPAAAPQPGPAPIPWTMNCPTPTATAVPGVPLNVVAVPSNSAITLSWSPAQANQPVTSYTVHNSFSSGAVIPDFVVSPVTGSAFPPTSTFIPAVNGTTYGFEVLASNAAGSSAFSAESAHQTPPGTQVPNPPTACPAPPCASAGDTQAFVSWTISSPNGTPITSYTVTAYINLVAQPITVTVPPPASGSIGTAVIGGLTNGTTYTFTVHATNVAGNSAEGPQTNAVTPSAANLPTLAISMTGPTSVTSTPVQLTYGVTVQNTSHFPATNVSMTHILTTVAATIPAGGAVRDASGNVTITTASAHFLSIGQSVTVAGVSPDASFNGTFTISNVLSSTTFNYSQAGLGASNNSGGGSATGLPTANILLAQPGQGSCTAGGAGVISVTCSLGNLDPGASTLINVIVQMQSQAIINSATASGNDAAGTVLVNANISKTTSPPQPVSQNASAAVGITGLAQNPNPNVGQAGNVTWTISDTTTTAVQNVVVTLFVPNGLTINAPNPPSVTVNNGGAGSCAAGVGATVNGISGTQFTCTTPTLGGSNKNGAKPPSTMIITQNVTPAAGTSKAVFRVIGNVSFGPGGTDTLPNSATVTITVK
ncbi:MAG TPA: fibronectin type III domain-containing protein [Candidatus Angelobacter sp.]|nr:fibronectin type III domain-containing protein [Candidatus Angelobacter sp.]